MPRPLSGGNLFVIFVSYWQIVLKNSRNSNFSIIIIPDVVPVLIKTCYG